jgi:hypothetical protein
MLHRIGAIFYALWGLLHALSAAENFRFALSLEADAIQGRLLQNSWNLAFFAIVALVVAVTMNWRNDRTGYWINLITVSAADIAFVLFILMPGHLPLWPGILGPVFWIGGAVFSTLGIVAKK